MVSILRKALSACKALRSRAFAVGALAVVMAFTIYEISDLTHAVYIRDGESVTLAYTMSDDVEDLLQKEGIEVSESDVVEFSGFTSSTAEVEIKRAFPVRLTADGETRTLQVADKTVADLLQSEGISLDGSDKVNLPMKRALREDDHVVVQRVDYTTRVEEREIPFETVATKTSLLRPGQTKVLTQGQDGKEVTTYSQKLCDGQLQSEEEVSTRVVAEPVAQEVLVGAAAAVSPLDFGYEMDESGAPVGYTRLLTEQKATGYSARPGTKTASGRYAVAGHVAVNTEVIPYGTKLYIASPDNSFVYGYAIAADTGTGLIDGSIDLDLFYDSYTESCLNGVRYVNVYVLD